LSNHHVGAWRNPSQTYLRRTPCGHNGPCHSADICRDADVSTRAGHRPRQPQAASFRPRVGFWLLRPWRARPLAARPSASAVPSGRSPAPFRGAREAEMRRRARSSFRAAPLVPGGASGPPFYISRPLEGVDGAHPGASAGRNAPGRRFLCMDEKPFSRSVRAQNGPGRRPDHGKPSHWRDARGARPGGALRRAPGAGKRNPPVTVPATNPHSGSDL